MGVIAGPDPMRLEVAEQGTIDGLDPRSQEGRDGAGHRRAGPTGSSSPIPQRRLEQRERRHRGGVGAQDAGGPREMAVTKGSAVQPPALGLGKARLRGPIRIAHFPAAGAAARVLRCADQPLVGEDQAAGRPAIRASTASSLCRSATFGHEGAAALLPQSLDGMGLQPVLAGCRSALVNSVWTGTMRATPQLGSLIFSTMKSVRAFLIGANSSQRFRRKDQRRSLRDAGQATAALCRPRPPPRRAIRRSRPLNSASSAPGPQPHHV